MKVKLLVKKGRSTFGNWLRISDTLNLPTEYDLLVLCVNKGQGYIPVRVLLLHQVYQKDVRAEMEEHNCNEAYVLFVKSKDSLLIAEQIY